MTVSIEHSVPPSPICTTASVDVDVEVVDIGVVDGRELLICAVVGVEVSSTGVAVVEVSRST